MRSKNTDLKKTKTYSSAEILEKAKKYCDYQERSHQETRDKLYSWGAHAEEVEQILALLISENYLNELRFASAFARGKANIKNWGKRKIEMELRLKKVPQNIINKALAEINDDSYEDALSKIIRKKAALLKNEKDSKIKERKIAAYAIGKGFEPEMVWAGLREFQAEE